MIGLEKRTRCNMCYRKVLSTEHADNMALVETERLACANCVRDLPGGGWHSQKTVTTGKLCRMLTDRGLQELQ